MKNTLLKIYRKTPVPMIRGKLEQKRNYKIDLNFINEQLSKVSKKNIFYFGVPRHSNLGDLAQYICIKEFLKSHYKEYSVIEIPSSLYINNINNTQKTINNLVSENDLIIFQSGYGTQDIGGYEDAVHKKVAELFPNNKLVLFPQTILFKSKERKKQTSDILDAHKKLLFLARDSISYETAIDMFPNTQVLKYPDIVTTLIGKYDFQTENKGILLCVRNDLEKYYSDVELNSLMEKLRKYGDVVRDDTVLDERVDCSHPNLRGVIENYIKNMSKYSVIITDRYHGTIFSLIANTPVIVIKTNDHKVTTGVDWFKGVYDNSIWHIDEINDVEKKVEEIIKSNLKVNNKPYFLEHYYDKLPEKIDKL